LHHGGIPQFPSTATAVRIQSNRPRRAAELAPAYVFLASQESRFITGEAIGVTGGKPIS
jgi:NAD(P)-dependent dehydrogenase (short-subunit alcohol dehydrogenase family)